MFMFGSVMSATGNETTAKEAIVNYRMWVGNDTNCYSRYTCGGEGNRTICDIFVEGSCHWCSLEGEVFNGTALIGDAPFCNRFIYIDNVEHKNFNVMFKIFPEPNNDCFGNFTPYNCNKTDWNPIIKLRLPRADISTDYVYLDTTPCWNWWNSSDEDVQREQSAYCPVGSIYLSSDIDQQRIEFGWADNVTGADIDYSIMFLGYSTSIVNIEEKVSPSMKTVVQSIAQLVSINIDIWKILYYMFLIVSIIVAVVFIVGFLPLSLKWILKKITE